MISFRSLPNGGHGAYDIGNDLIAVCRELTDSEKRGLENEGLGELLLNAATEDPSDWDCWEVVVNIDENLKTVVQKMLASLWVAGSAIDELVHGDE